MNPAPEDDCEEAPVLTEVTGTIAPGNGDGFALAIK